MGFWQYAVSPRRQVWQRSVFATKESDTDALADLPARDAWTDFFDSTQFASWPGTRGYTTPGNCPSTVPASE